MRQTLIAAAPVALAIAVFGTIYGATAAPLMGAGTAVLSSLIVFSGALQFAAAGLLAAGAPAAAFLLVAVTLNLRHLLLGAALRPRIGGGALRRAALAWFLIDEAFGFAATTRGDAARTLLATGILFGLAWVLGTAAGTLGAALTGLAAVSEALFPILFVGLAAMAAQRRDLMLRAVGAAALTFALASLWPQARGLAPVAAAIAAALVGRAR